MKHQKFLWIYYRLSRKAVPFVILAFFWVNFHELLHALAIWSQGFTPNFQFEVVRQSVTCIDCIISEALIARPEQMVFIASLPYFVGIFALLFAIVVKNKWTWLLGNIIILDTLVNYFSTSIPGITTDFTIMARLGNPLLVIFIGLVITLLLYLLNREKFKA